MEQFGIDFLLESSSDGSDNWNRKSGKSKNSEAEKRQRPSSHTVGHAAKEVKQAKDPALSSNFSFGFGLENDGGAGFGPVESFPPNSLFTRPTAGEVLISSVRATGPHALLQTTGVVLGTLAAGTHNRHLSSGRQRLGEHSLASDGLTMLPKGFNWSLLLTLNPDRDPEAL